MITILARFYKFFIMSIWLHIIYLLVTLLVTYHSPRLLVKLSSVFKEIEIHNLLLLKRIVSYLKILKAKFL